MNLVVAFSLCVSLQGADAGGDRPDAVQLRAVAQRSVPFLETRGQEWIDERNCVSCHQVPFMLWSLREAQQHGLAVDEAKLRDTFAWSVDMKHWAASVDEAKFSEQTVADGNIDSLYQLIFAAGYAGEKELPQSPEWVKSYAAHLVKRQQADGSWKACGQFPTQKRPARESTEASTMWTLLALAPQDEPEDALKEQIQRAREALAKAEPGKSSEWWALRLLVERRYGEKSRADELLAELLGKQRDDGGWGWLVEQDSDALATGFVLYALRGEEDEKSRAAIGRAHKFLVDTQQDDGSWKVASTQARHKGAVKPTTIYWGTAWAVIGILSTLPK
jgi:squalene-hopene/tetraprenyl-beta-curcumene cyclase